MLVMKHISLVTVLLLLVGFTNAQDTIYLNVQTCRTLAVENSASIKIAQEKLAKARGEKKAAFSAYLPNISASATGIYRNTEVQQELIMPTKVFDSSTGQLVPNVVMNPSTGQPVLAADGNPVFNTYAYLPLDVTLYGGALATIKAEQPLYAGGKIVAGNKMAEIGEQMASSNIALNRSKQIYEADQVYYQYLSVKEKVVLAKQYKKLLEELVQIVSDSYAVGMTNKNDLLKVQVKYNEACLQTQQAESGLELMRMSLCRLVGVDFTTNFIINDSISSVNLDANSFPNSNAKARVEYQLLQKQVEMQQQDLNFIKGDYKPTAGIALAYNSAFVALDGIDNQQLNGFSAMASVKIPITQFGERKGKTNVKRAELNIKQLELEQAAGYLQLEIEQAKSQLINARTAVSLNKEALNQADENVRICADSYNLGMETIVNLLEARAQWQKAYSSLIDAQTNLKVQESNYLRVTNGL